MARCVKIAIVKTLYIVRGVNMKTYRITMQEVIEGGRLVILEIIEAEVEDSVEAKIMPVVKYLSALMGRCPKSN